MCITNINDEYESDGSLSKYDEDLVDSEYLLDDDDVDSTNEDEEGDESNDEDNDDDNPDGNHTTHDVGEFLVDQGVKLVVIWVFAL